MNIKKSIIYPPIYKFDYKHTIFHKMLRYVVFLC